MMQISDRSRNALTLQLKSHINLISVLGLKNKEYNIVKFYLDELKYLVELLNVDFIIQNYHDAIRKVQDYICD